MSDHVRILDTTLRDGEQSPGIHLNKQDKLDIALQLETLGVDIIEAGFAAASEGDFESVSAVAEAVDSSVVCSLSRAVERDIDLTAQAVGRARRGRIHIVLATSPVHLEHKLMMTEDEVLERALWAVKRARNYSDDVEFSFEDASRSDFDFLARITEATIAAGATTVSFPDTVGRALPEHYGALLARLIETVPSSDRATFSAHCHDDLGLAVANSLAAIRNGARQVECTVNGIGERAGNASMEEIVMALRTHGEHFGASTRIETRHLVATSNLVSERTGFAVPPNKAIVGRNAFQHEAGIHQDGMLKNPLTYQFLSPEEVGWSRFRIVLGKHSGRRGFAEHMRSIGIEFESGAHLHECFMRFKAAADAGTVLDDATLRDLVHSS